jgi:hypothetical protein
MILMKVDFLGANMALPLMAPMLVLSKYSAYGTDGIRRNSSNFTQEEFEKKAKC